MNIFSFSAYKEKLVAGLFGDKVIVNLPAAPLSVSRTRYEGAELNKSHWVTPGEVMSWIESHEVMTDDGSFIVMIAGPGDPLATPEQTIDIMETVKTRYPNVTFALRSHGFGGADRAERLAELGVDYVELVTDGLDVAALEDIYLWIRPARKTLSLSQAGPILFDEQQKTIKACKEHGITVCGCITLYADSVEGEMADLTGSLKEMGVDLVAINVHKSAGIGVEAVEGLKREAGDYLPVTDSLLTHCCGTPETGAATTASMDALPRPTGERPNVAVVSSSGMDVDLHLGHAVKILIYGPRGDGLPCLLEARDAPEPGGGKSRWTKLADVLSDCFVLLVASAGESPRRVLGEHGIRVLVVQDAIEGCVDVLYGGGKKRKKNVS